MGEVGGHVKGRLRERRGRVGDVTIQPVVQEGGNGNMDAAIIVTVLGRYVFIGVTKAVKTMFISFPI